MPQSEQGFSKHGIEKPGPGSTFTMLKRTHLSKGDCPISRVLVDVGRTTYTAMHILT